MMLGYSLHEDADRARIYNFRGSILSRCEPRLRDLHLVSFRRLVVIGDDHMYPPD
jgi:hypothetical protein